MHTDHAHDWRLLRQYVKNDSQTAFTEIVNRYINLVYATSRREVGDASMAEDVTQVVFLTLARRAPVLLPDVDLSRWLFTAARFTARDALKQERRRRIREMKAVEEAAEPSESADGPLELAVNAALETLNKDDWRAVHLRFYEGLSLADVGVAFGVSEDTAQKRVSRALQRMRRSLTASGMALSLVAIEELLRTEAARAASEHLVQAVMGGGGLAVATGSMIGSTHLHQLAKGILKTMFVKNVVIASAVVVIGVSTVMVAPVIGGKVLGAEGAPVNSRPVVVDKKKADDAKKAYLAQVHEYNQRWVRIYDNLAKYSDPKVRYGKITATATGLSIRAYSPSIAETGRYLEKIYHEPDFTTVSIDHLPGYPEAMVRKIYVHGKLVSIKPAGGSWGTVKPTAKHFGDLPPREKVYPVRQVLAKELARVHSEKERRQIIWDAMYRATVKTVPAGFWMTVKAKLKTPLR